MAGSFQPKDQLLDPGYLWEPPGERGDNAPMSVRVPAMLKRISQEVIQSGVFRFRTETDLTRTALAWFFREKVAPYMHDGRIDRSLQTVSMLSRLNIEAQRAADIGNFVTQTRASLREMVRNNLLKRAREHWTTLVDQLTDMPDQEWSQEAMEQLRGDDRMKTLLTMIEGGRQ